jgi:hypothetical protein
MSVEISVTKEQLIAWKLMNWSDEAFNRFTISEIINFLEDKKNKAIFDLLSRCTGEFEIDNWDMRVVPVVRTMKDQIDFVAVKLKETPELIDHVNKFLDFVKEQYNIYTTKFYYDMLDIEM